MRFPDDRMPYIVATNVFRQGIECDNAAGLIRQRLPEFLAGIAREVKENLSPDYMLEKEQEWLKHLDHGKSSDGQEPDEPDCSCRGTEYQRECAWQGCGFCRAAIPKDDEDIF